MKHLAIALIFGSSVLCFAGQTVPPPGDICGHVLMAASHQPVGDAQVVAMRYGSAASFPKQTTAADGSFCFRSAPPGQYGLYAFKAGFTVIQSTAGSNGGEDAMIGPGKPTPEIHFKMMPMLPVSSAADLTTMLPPARRQDLQLERASFSPDGRYLAVSVLITGKDSEYGEQTWRYDMETRKWLAITPEPADQAPGGGDFEWSGDVLYASSTGLFGRMLYFKTEGETTTAIDLFPPEIKRTGIWEVPIHLHVGSYVVDGDVVEGTSERLSVGKIVITDDVVEDDWATLDNPPAVFYAQSLDAIYVFYLKTGHRQIARVPNTTAKLLAVTPMPRGFRVAYQVRGQCGVDPRSLTPDFRFSSGPPAQANLCFVDVPDESRTGQ